MVKLMRAAKFLASGEGDSFQMLTHTFTSKVTAEDTKRKWVMYEASDTVGNGAPIHSHPWEETFYVLEGELDIQLGERRVIAETGSSIYFPKNVVHSFTVRSETARLLVILPGFADAFYRDVSKEISTLPPNEDKFQAIASKHKVQLIA